MLALLQRCVAFVYAWPSVVFLALALFVMRGLFGPGPILTLDSPYSYYQAPTTYYGLDERWVSAGAPLYLLLNVIQGMIPLWAMEKTLLVATLWLAGIGAFHLAPVSRPGRYFAGTLYTLNPFTYERFVAGQWGLLLGYAIVPLALSAFIRLLQHQKPRDIAIAATLMTGVAMASVHEFFIVAGISAVVWVIWLSDRKHTGQLCRGLLLVALTILAVIVVNAYWILPAITAPHTVVDEFTDADFTAFAPRAFSSLGVAFDTAALYGMWRVSPAVQRPDLPLHALASGMVWGLAAIGVLRGWSRWRTDNTQERTVWTFYLVGVSALFFSLGVSTWMTGKVYRFLWDHMPFFQGFREPNKFVGSLALSYAVLGAFGIEAIERVLDSCKRTWMRYINRVLIVTLVVGIPVSFAWFFVAGLDRQLATTDFPSDWVEAKAVVEGDPGDYSLLVLPWHHYMRYPWLPNSDKTLANPARRFFGKPVIMGDTLDIGTDSIQNPVSRYVSALLQEDARPTTLGASLVPLGVKYVVLFHAGDYEAYEPLLAQQADLRLLLTREHITVYKNQREVSRFYAISRSSDSGTIDMRPVASTRESPVNYRVPEIDGQLLAFAPPQESGLLGWRYEGRDSVETVLGVAAVFYADEAGGQALYSRFFRVYVPAYIVSSVGVALMAAVMAFGARREPGKELRSRGC